MSFQILNPVSCTGSTFLNIGKDDRAIVFGRLEMPSDVFEVYQHAIKNVGYLSPLRCYIADLTMMFWTLVIGGGRRQHYYTIAHGYLSMRKSPVIIQHPGIFYEAKGLTKPGDCSKPILIGKHGYDLLIN